MLDAFHFGSDSLIQFVLRVQVVQDMNCGLQCIHPCVWNGSMRHFAVHCHFHLQATVVRSNHLITETCRNHEVGFGESFVQ